MRTLKYIGRRLLVLVPQLFLISIITFTLVRMLPGDPARLELGPLAPEEGVELLRHQLRLDKPLPQQYIAYLQRLLQGDFGRSWVNSSSVAQDLLVRAPATLELITAGMLIVLRPSPHLRLLQRAGVGARSGGQARHPGSSARADHGLLRRRYIARWEFRHL